MIVQLVKFELTIIYNNYDISVSLVNTLYILRAQTSKYLDEHT